MMMRMMECSTVQYSSCSTKQRCLTYFGSGTSLLLERMFDSCRSICRHELAVESTVQYFAELSSPLELGELGSWCWFLLLTLYFILQYPKDQPLANPTRVSDMLTNQPPTSAKNNLHKKDNRLPQTTPPQSGHPVSDMLPLIPQEICHHVLKHPLGPSLDDIPVARNQPLKVPPVNPLH